MTRNDNNGSASECNGNVLPQWAQVGLRCEVLVDNQGWQQAKILRISTVTIEVELWDADATIVVVENFRKMRPIMLKWDAEAQAVAGRVRATNRGFLTMRKDELRDAFGVGRFTEAQSDAVCEALFRNGAFVFPRPYSSGPSLRIYECDHPVAQVAEAILEPDSIPETPLRQAADLFAREKAGRELRSDDAPWLTIFDLFLQLLIGRQPDGWEDLRDDRHPSQVATELAAVLGLDPGLAADDSTTRIAAAVCAFRPRRRNWQVSAFVPEERGQDNAQPLVAALHASNRSLRDLHEQLLRQAAQLLLLSDLVPDHPVEVGLLGLRYCREDDERTFE
jgi:hypothetical protein